MTLSLRKPLVTLPSGRAVSTRPQSGFTLIEIMFAMVIFAIGVLGLMACLPMASNRVMKSGSQTLASSLAAQAAEELLTVPYGHGSLTAGTHNDPANPHQGMYYTRWVVENDQPLTSCKRITITVARGAVSNFPVVRLVLVTPQSGG
jgi:prepilin-type N-terminal cleavage/methylation domain-containing protein